MPSRLSLPPATTPVRSSRPISSLHRLLLALVVPASVFLPVDASNEDMPEQNGVPTMGYGPAGGSALSPDWAVKADELAAFGTSVASAGDV